MKIYKFLSVFLCLVFPFLLLAQSTPHEEEFSNFQSDAQLFEPTSFVSSSGEIIVLDSVITIIYPDEYLIRNIYEYETVEGRISKSLNYNTNLDGQQYLYNQYGWSYDNNSKAVIYQEFDVTLDPPQLEKQSKTEFINDIDDNPFIETFLLWSPSINDWVESHRYLYQIESDNLTTKSKYSWNETDVSYDLESKVEFIKDGTKDIQLDYKFENGQFSHAHRQEIKDYLSPEFLQFWSVSYYNPISEEFDVIRRQTSYFNFDNISGHVLSERLYDTELMIEDSITFTLNEDYQTLTYLRHPTPEYEPFRKSEVIYREDGLRDKVYQSTFNSELQEYIPVFNAQFYYSELEVETSSKDISTNFPLDLRYANPSSKDQSIQILNDDYTINYEYWITNQTGAIIDNGNVNGEIQINLAPDISSGLYYITLFSKDNQKTWKIVVQ